MHENTSELILNCFNKLKKEILNGVYLPGEKLSMPKLKENLQMGQSPIREALSRILSIELVELEENKGFHVTKISEKDLRDLFQTIIQIENIAIRQSLELGNNSWEIKLVASFHKLALEVKKESPDYFAWVECNIDFHRFLILGCNSNCLIKIHDLLFLKLERYVKLGLDIDKIFIDQSHQRKNELFQAALKRDHDEACRLFSISMTQHLESIIQSLKNKKLFPATPP